jgi:PAS domain S-box-containing protein
MKDQSKTKQVLIQELVSLRQRISELERSKSERKNMEEALRESEDFYRSRVEAINDVAYSINSSGEFTYISPVVKNVLGYEPDEMTGRHFLEFAHQDDHDLLTRKFSELREGVVSYDEYRVIGKSGDVVWMRSQTSPILDIGGFAGGRGILVDISEKKRAEEALHRLKENFRRSLDESPLGVRIVTEEGETLYANRAILGIYGYDSIEELNTTPIQKRYARESYAEFQIRREKRRQGIDVPPEYTIDIIRKNGDVRHLRVFRKGIPINLRKPMRPCGFFSATEKKT